MKAYVVMGNDFPDAVFSDGPAAESYVAAKIEEDRKRRETNRLAAQIHWRWHEFEMR